MQDLVTLITDLVEIESVNPIIGSDGLRRGSNSGIRRDLDGAGGARSHDSGDGERTTECHRNPAWDWWRAVVDAERAHGHGQRRRDDRWIVPRESTATACTGAGRMT